MIIRFREKKRKKNKKRTRSISYFCGGTKPILNLLVSLYSLRKFYKGEISVVLGETSVPYLYPLTKCKDFVVEILPHSARRKRKKWHMSDRWRAMEMTNLYDKTIHFDCDNIVVRDFEPLWEMVDSDKDCITSLYYRKEWEKHKANKFDHVLKLYRRIEPKFTCEIDDVIYMQCGCIGYNRGWPYFQEVSQHCKRVQSDQAALSFVLTSHRAKAKLVENYYYIDSRRYYRFVSEMHRNQVAIWHCTRSLSVPMWWKCFMEARKSKFLDLHDNDYIKTLSVDAYNHIIKADWDNKILRPIQQWKRKGEVLEAIPRE